MSENQNFSKFAKLFFSENTFFMEKLYFKVEETQKLNNHSIDDIDDVVKSRVTELNNKYRSTGFNKKKIEQTYVSDEFQAFMSCARSEEDKVYRELLDACILHTTNIAKFINKNTKRIQDKSKDFFAVYCDCEGYNDFIVKHKNLKIAESSLANESSKITFNVNQYGENPTNIGEINTDTLYL